MQTVRAFQPIPGETETVSNATSATAAVNLKYDWDAVVLTNTSATAIVYVRVTQYMTDAVGAGDAPTTTDDMPVLPMSQIRIYVGEGNKVIRTIASAADGTIKITPGRGI